MGDPTPPPTPPTPPPTSTTTTTTTTTLSQHLADFYSSSTRSLDLASSIAGMHGKRYGISIAAVRLRHLLAYAAFAIHVTLLVCEWRQNIVAFIFGYYYFYTYELCDNLQLL